MIDLSTLKLPALRAYAEGLRREVSEWTSREQAERLRANLATARYLVAETEIERLRAMLGGKL